MAHVPLGLAFLLPAVTVAFAVALWRHVLARRAWVIAIGLQSLLVVAGIVTLRTGAREGGCIQTPAGEQAVAAHERDAQAFVWGASFVLVAIASVVVVPRRAAVPVTIAAVVGSLAVAGLAYRTSKNGGELAHDHGTGGACAAATPDRHATLPPDGPGRGEAEHQAWNRR